MPADGRNRGRTRHGNARVHNTETVGPDDYDYVSGSSRGCLLTALSFCLVGAAVLAVPVVVFLLPFLSSTFSLVSGGGSSSTSGMSSRATRPPWSRPTPATSASTPGTAPVQGPCYPRSPNFTFDPMADHTPMPLSQTWTSVLQPVYCLYNASRAQRPNPYSFYTIDLPPNLCQGIVYWSWSFAEGNFASRNETFEQRFGLTKIWSLYIKANVLLTLGGFREDSADFYKINSDDVMRYRLVQGCYDAYRRYNLSGINLHWVRGSDACEAKYGDGFPRLGKFIDVLRKLVSLNTRGDRFSVTAMIDPQLPHDMLLFRSIYDRLDLAFLKTHELGPQDSFFPDHHCKNSVRDFQFLLSRLEDEYRAKAFDAAQPPYSGFCMSVTLSLYAWKGGFARAPASAQPVSATPGRMALFEVCDSKESFRSAPSSLSAGCEVRRSLDPQLDLTFAFESADTVGRKMELLGGDKRNTCVLVYDVDFDNYQRSCISGDNERHLLMLYLYKARNPAMNFNISEHLP
ncbi:hypothetical protein HPB48_011974 [Haemaphysalis longicornis]|uniref:GH18 domain-containing protein n=1 Tax=Haemaphysalis longicornis TaxID=44386 RepID=A0A9J6H3U4_HAELO|nr:hypothetical protein HPB48_011974 [Haemaphysalis longicornis]